MHLRDIGFELFMGLEDADPSFINQVMELNEDLRQIVVLQDVLKNVNMQFLEQWVRMQLNAPAQRLTQQEVVLIRHVIVTLQECERELEYIREVFPENATCPKCGKPYFKNTEQAKKLKKDPKKAAKKEDKNRN